MVERVLAECLMCRLQKKGFVRSGRSLLGDAYVRNAGVASEGSVLWRAWERNDVAYVLHAGDEEYEALEAEAEAGMWA